MVGECSSSVTDSSVAMSWESPGTYFHWSKYQGQVKCDAYERVNGIICLPTMPWSNVRTAIVIVYH